MNKNKKSKKAPTALEIINNVRKNILTKPQRWLKGRLATNNQGICTHPESTDACRFCVSGAVSRAVSTELGPRGISSFSFTLTEQQRKWDALRNQAMELLNQAAERTHKVTSVIDLNDRRSTRFADIRKVLNSAARKRAKKR